MSRWWGTEVLTQIEKPKAGDEGSEVLRNESNGELRYVQMNEFQRGCHGSHGTTPGKQDKHHDRGTDRWAEFVFGRAWTCTLQPDVKWVSLDFLKYDFAISPEECVAVGAVSERQELCSRR